MESNLSLKRSNEPNHYRRRSITSVDYRLISFYSYLTALSFCDLFSCLFAILNVLEYLLPFYLEMDSLRYHELCQSLQIYTHPIATTLQALSCWLICAFSIHRCKSIAKPTEWFGCLKNQATNESINNAKKYSISSVIQTMWVKANRSFSRAEDDISMNSSRITNPRSIYEMTVHDMRSNKPMRQFCHFFSKISRARLIIILLYIVSVIYLIPQWFEKKLTYIEIQHRVYVFTAITDFGQSKLYRQVFHLWFYMLGIYIIPFLLILFFNLILLRTFLDSKKKCSQYKLKSDANSIIKDLTSSAAPQVTFLSSGINGLREGIQIQASSSSDILAPVLMKKEPKARRLSVTVNSNRVKRVNKSRALTLTLFGVVAIFFACHFPAAVAKIIYVVYPKVEFESVFASFFLDLSNFLIMVNSSINFLLYIVFGPGKFRQEFTYLFFKFFKCFKRKSAADDNTIVFENLDLSDLHLNRTATSQPSKNRTVKKFITIVENEEVRLKQAFDAKQYNTPISLETSDGGQTNRSQETASDEQN